MNIKKPERLKCPDCDRVLCDIVARNMDAKYEITCSCGIQYLYVAGKLVQQAVLRHPTLIKGKPLERIKILNVMNGRALDKLEHYSKLAKLIQKELKSVRPLVQKVQIVEKQVEAVVSAVPAEKILETLQRTMTHDQLAALLAGMAK